MKTREGNRFYGRILGIASTVALAVTATLLGAPAAFADSAPKDPADPLTPTTVTADALPTVQIDGVVWSQVVIGNTVYAGGSFTTARPAGAAPGTQTVARGNILAYDIRTGELISSFAPNFNAQVLSLAASPDGTRLYVGGDFTTLNGQSANHMVALNPSTGARIENFNPNPSNSVRAIVATDTTVYLGGSFFRLGEAWREQAAAVRASDAALLAFRPVVNGGQVDSLALSPDGTKLAIGGKFTTVNDTTENASGLAVVNTSTGAKYAYPAAAYIRNGGETGSITSIATDADTFYASGYTYGRATTLEGVVAIKWADLDTRWVEDCHGDTYSVHATGQMIYIAGHPHYCGNIGGFAQEPQWQFNRALSFSKAVAGTIDREIHGYTNYEGLPHPQLQAWFPALSTGTYTGQSQGPWSVTGNKDYVVYGGEFLRANYRDQQGLVRFALRQNAPNQRGPLPFGADFVPTLSSTTTGQVRVRWQAAEDMDNRTLTYKVIRDGNTANPVHTFTADSTFWARPGLSFTDKNLTPGSTHSYRVFVSDPTGREARSSTVSITVASQDAPSSDYEQVIKADKPVNYWPIKAPDGATVIDAAGNDDLSLAGNAGVDARNAIDGGSGHALSLGSGAAQDPTRRVRPQEFSTELWFKAGVAQRGRLIGYGNGQSGNSTNHDRLTYLNTVGQLSFGVYDRGTRRVITSPGIYTDNRWHHVVSTVGPDGMRLYVDGKQVAERTATTSALELDGFWRLGQDRVNGWSGAPTSGFSGLLDEVAIYDTQLSAAKIEGHFKAGLGQAVNVSPAAAFDLTVDGMKASVDGSASSDPDGTIAAYAWDFGDGKTASGATASHDYAEPGTYQVKLTVTDNDGATDSATRSVTIQAPPEPNRAPVAKFEVVQTNGLSIEVDASDSSDPDGDALSYGWNFGDGSAAVTGKTASHTYAAAGSYQVTLTATDPDGLKDTATATVSVQATAGPLAQDAFGRTVQGGWGEADLGGIWTRTGGTSTAAVSGGMGHLVGANPGSGPAIYLPAMQGTDAVGTIQVQLDKPPTGGGAYLYFSPRYFSNANQYLLKSRITSTGGLQVQLVRTLEGTETLLATTYQSEFGYQAGQVINLKVSVTGTSPTRLAARAWAAGDAEPAGWLLEASDSTASLQAPGGVGLRLYVSGSATNTPLTASFDNLVVRRE